METVSLEPQVLAKRHVVAFGLVRQDHTVECEITIAALEAYFWLEPHVNEATKPAR